MIPAFVLSDARLFFKHVKLNDVNNARQLYLSYSEYPETYRNKLVNVNRVDLHIGDNEPNWFFSWSPIHTAIEHFPSSMPMIRFLVEECQVDVNDDRSFGHASAFETVCRSQNRPLIRYFLENTEADLTYEFSYDFDDDHDDWHEVITMSTNNQSIFNPLWTMLEKNNLGMLKELVDGHSLNIHMVRNYMKNTPFEVVFRNGSMEMLNWYVNNVGLPEIHDQEEFYTCGRKYLTAPIVCESENEDGEQLLFAKFRFAVEVMGADPRCSCNCGVASCATKSIFALACDQGKEYIRDYLVEKFPDINS